MVLPVTSLYVLPLTIIYLGLFFAVSAKRSNLSVSIGDAGDVALHERIRRHGNFVEWVPLVLLLLVIAELQGTPRLWLHLAGGLLVLGRVIHPIGLKATAPTHPLRIAGNSTNLLATVILTIAISYAAFIG